MQRIYETLENGKYDLKALSAKEQGFLKRVFDYYHQKPDRSLFSNYWLREGQKVWAGTPRKEVVDLPIFNICLDLEMRLGIGQGYMRLPDYRDKLQGIIDDKFQSRYQFCKKTGISQDTLSRILNKRREPSLRLLKTILDALGYEISFQKKQT
jgi:hypothetical protein